MSRAEGQFQISNGVLFVLSTSRHFVHWMMYSAKEYFGKICGPRVDHHVTLGSGIVAPMTVLDPSSSATSYLSKATTFAGIIRWHSATVQVERGLHLSLYDRSISKWGHMEMLLGCFLRRKLVPLPVMR